MDRYSGEERTARRVRTAVDPAQLEAHVRTLVGFSPRNETPPENLGRAAAWIRRELERAGGRVEDQPFKVRGATYRNAIAHFGPATRERIVVGAHYDAAGPYPGADDNASGVEGLLELARLLGKICRRPTSSGCPDYPTLTAFGRFCAIVAHQRSVSDCGGELRFQYIMPALFDPGGSQAASGPTSL